MADSLTEHWSTKLSNFDGPKQKLLHLSIRYVHHQQLVEMLVDMIMGVQLTIIQHWFK